MKNNQLKTLFSIGAAIAASPLFRSISHAQAFSDPLSMVGLERRSARIAERSALIGVGIMLGAGAALLFAPASGSDTRRRIGQKVDSLTKEAKQLSDRASEYLHEAAENAPIVGHHSNGVRSTASSSSAS